MGKGRGRVRLYWGNIYRTRGDGSKVSTQLVQIAKKAQLDRKVRFTSLAHLLTPEFLKETWKTINRHGAGGVDGESIGEFESELEQRVQEICVQLRAGAYRAPPVRRVEIPKGPARPERGRWEFPLSLTACFKRRCRAFSKRSLKQISATSATGIVQDGALITRCPHYASKLGSGGSITCLRPIFADTSIMFVIRGCRKW